MLQAETRMGLKIETIKVGQKVKIINSDAFTGLTWVVIGFNDTLVCLRNEANHVWYMSAHPSNLQ
jgi:hypothetical protein